MVTPSMEALAEAPGFLAFDCEEELPGSLRLLSSQMLNVHQGGFVRELHLYLATFGTCVKRIEEKMRILNKTENLNIKKEE